MAMATKLTIKSALNIFVMFTLYCCDTQHNNIQHSGTLNIMTFSTMTVSKMTFAHEHSAQLLLVK
jgi:hypothetical protein